MIMFVKTKQQKSQLFGCIEKSKNTKGASWYLTNENDSALHCAVKDVFSAESGPFVLFSKRRLISKMFYKLLFEVYSTPRIQSLYCITPVKIYILPSMYDRMETRGHAHQINRLYAQFWQLI